MIWARKDCVFTFRYYDIIRQEYRYSNATTYESLKEFREKILKSKAFRNVGDIYERNIARPFTY